MSPGAKKQAQRSKPRIAALQSAGTAKRAGPAAYPAFIEPCHPAERERPPSNGSWIHEIKADGYRAQVHVREGKVTVYSRRGYDWTQIFASSSIARAAEALNVRHAVLDGEAIVQDARGVADFYALRRELARKQSGNLTYYAFDLLFLDGQDLRGRPLIERKQKLKSLLAKARHGFLFADHLEADPQEVYAQACRMGLEGIVSKRGDAPYGSGDQDEMQEERDVPDHCLRRKARRKAAADGVLLCRAARRRPPALCRQGAERLHA
jgi:bifunctional non-homologous end joining protein LigD